MNCTRYRKWIKRAALSSLDAWRQARLDAHLAECDGCRELFNSERRLAESINLALTASVAAAPPADFAAGVRIRLAEDRARLQPGLVWVRSGWVPVSVAGIVALVALLVVMWPALRQRTQPQPVRLTARVSAPSTPAPASVPPAASGHANPVVASSASHSEVLSAVARPERPRTNRSTRIEGGAPQFQVIVEPGQWQAILTAYRSAQTAHVDADALANTSNREEQPVEMKPIEINPVAIAELYPYTQAVPGGR